MNPIAVRCENLIKSYGGARAVNDVSLSVVTGEILALLGPSGCGKTTTLRLIAGFEKPDFGQVEIGGRLVAGRRLFIPPEQRGVGMVFQDYAVFPHLTVLQNVVYGLKGQKPSQMREIAMMMLKVVGMERFVERYPHELSGGERQRVALARALAPRPILLLMDEPFSSLDADLRVQVREQVRGILKTMQATAIFVTHDQEEALYMGDRLAVFQKGRLEQVGLPEEIFHTPATHFVAEFMGSTDFLAGQVTPEGILTELGLLPQKVDLPAGTLVEIAMRPDDVSFEPQAQGRAMVLERMFRGAFNVYRLRLPSGHLLHTYQSHTRLVKPGTRARVYIIAGHDLAVFHEGRGVNGKEN
jgi:iron(III) transport system ATP-binding protein